MRLYCSSVDFINTSTQFSHHLSLNFIKKHIFNFCKCQNKTVLFPKDLFLIISSLNDIYQFSDNYSMSFSVAKCGSQWSMYTTLEFLKNVNLRISQPCDFLQSDVISNESQLFIISTRQCI